MDAFDAPWGQEAAIFVGDPISDSAAGYRLSDPDEVRELLLWYADGAGDGQHAERALVGARQH